MGRVSVHGHIRKTGNSLAFIIPAAEARRAGLRPGQAARADIEPDEDDGFGMNADIYDGPYDRASEEPKLARD